MPRRPSAAAAAVKRAAVQCQGHSMTCIPQPPAEAEWRAGTEGQKGEMDTNLAPDAVDIRRQRPLEKSHASRKTTFWQCDELRVGNA